MKVSTCIITGYGINADYELSEAFKMAGSDARRIHINDIIEKPDLTRLFHIIAFPGGFSFGDHLGSGKVFSTLFKKNLKEELMHFVDRGGLIIGICNGFQVLVKMGILPNITGKWEQSVSLIHNISGSFIDKWVRVDINEKSRCIWTKGIKELDLPIRHGEGRFITKSDGVLEEIEKRNLVVMRYSEENPNGSVNDIAAVCDESGRIFGLMPHPEAFLFKENHPQWYRYRNTVNLKLPEQENGLAIFKNGVNYLRRNCT